MTFVLISLLIVLLTQLLAAPLEPEGWSTRIGSPVEGRRLLIACMVSLSLFVVSACKAIVLQNGPDLLQYLAKYQSLGFETYSSLLAQYFSGQLKDVGFYLLAKVAFDAGLPAGAWMGLVALVYAAAMGFFVYNCSASPAMSAAIVVACFFSFTLTGLRQTVAMSVVLVAYVLYLRSKKAACLALILLAGLFHSSAWVALLVFASPLVRRWEAQTTVVVLSFAASVAFPSMVRFLIGGLAWNESLASYAGSSASLNWMGYAIQLTMFLFCHLMRGRGRRLTDGLERAAELGLALMSFGLAFQCMSSIVAEAFRISFYFSMGSIVAVPGYVCRIRDEKIRSAVYGLVLLVLCAYTVLSGAYGGLLYVWDV